MSELPNSWSRARLPLVCTKITDGTHHSPPNTQTGDFKYVTAKNIRQHGLDLQNITYVTSDVHEPIFARCPVEKDDVLYIKDGATTGLAINNPLDEPFSILSSVALLKPNRDVLDPHFLKYWLNSPDTLKSMLGQMSGSAIRRLTLTTISAQELPLPPLPEQRRIVAKLDSLRARSSRARHELDAIPKLIERYKQAILAKAFSGELTKDWRKARSQISRLQDSLSQHSRLIGRALDLPANPDGSALPDLPKGWRWLQAQDSTQPDADIVYGIVQPGPKLEIGIPYVRGKDIQNGTILVDQLLKTSPTIAERYARASLRGGDVLLGIIRDTKVAIVPDSLDGANITQGTARLRPANFINSEYLACWLRSRFAQKWLQDHYRGIDMPGLNLRDVRKCPIPVCDPAEQDEIMKRLNSSLDWLDKIATEHACTEHLLPKLDQAILAKAFRGELVPQDPNDEPASVLLDRIRAERERGEHPTRRRARSA